MTNPKSKTQNSKSDPLLPLARRVDVLAGDLARARKYGTGLVLCVVFSVETTRVEMERQLLTRLAEQGLRARRVQFKADEPPEAVDLPARLQADPPAVDEVVLLYDIRHAFPGLLTSLNYRRELVPENKWRLLFWLCEAEIIRLMRDAPDFWAFVNQTVELPETPPPAEHARQAKQLTWSDLEWDYEFRRLTPDERRARIALRERLLADLPEDETTVAARADLHFVIGVLYYFDQQLKKSEEHRLAALKLAEQNKDRQLQSSILNGLGNVYSTQGRYEEARGAYKQAIELDAKDASPWHGLGIVYSLQGRPDEGLAALQQTVVLEPNDATLRSSLARALRQAGRETEAAEHLARARELMENESDYNKACLEAIAGSAEVALDRLEQALAQAPKMRDWAKQDPDFETLRGHPRFKALVGGK